MSESVLNITQPSLLQADFTAEPPDRFSSFYHEEANSVIEGCEGLDSQPPRSVKFVNNVLSKSTVTAATMCFLASKELFK